MTSRRHPSGPASRWLPPAVVLCVALLAQSACTTLHSVPVGERQIWAEELDGVVGVVLKSGESVTFGQGRRTRTILGDSLCVQIGPSAAHPYLPLSAGSDSQIVMLSLADIASFDIQRIDSQKTVLLGICVYAGLRLLSEIDLSWDFGGIGGPIGLSELYASPPPD